MGRSRGQRQEEPGRGRKSLVFAEAPGSRREGGVGEWVQGGQQLGWPSGSRSGMWILLQVPRETIGRFYAGE